MSLNLALLIILLLIVLYIIFIEIFTVVFMITGMSHSRAIFQVISLFTNSGFTTSESEIVVSSRKRRKIAITIMIFDKLVKRIATRVMFSKGSNPILILDNFYGFVIVEVKIKQVPEILESKTLIESKISRNYGIKVLTIKRSDKMLTDIQKDDVVLNNDRLIVYGPLKSIIEVFKQEPSHHSAH